MKDLTAIRDYNIKMDAKELGCGVFHWIVFVQWWTEMNIITKILFPQMTMQFVEKPVGWRFFRKGSKLLSQILIKECHEIYSNANGHI